MSTLIRSIDLTLPQFGPGAKGHRYTNWISCQILAGDKSIPHGYKVMITSIHPKTNTRSRAINPFKADWDLLSGGTVVVKYAIYKQGSLL